MNSSIDLAIAVLRESKTCLTTQHKLELKCILSDLVFEETKEEEKVTKEEEKVTREEKVTSTGEPITRQVFTEENTLITEGRLPRAWTGTPLSNAFDTLQGGISISEYYATKYPAMTLSLDPRMEELNVLRGELADVQARLEIIRGIKQACRERLLSQSITPTSTRIDANLTEQEREQCRDGIDLVMRLGRLKVQIDKLQENK